MPATGYSRDGFSKEPLFKGPAPWEITADRLTYNQKEDTYTAEGHVVISKDDQHLYSQRAVYNRRTGIAQVYGDVRLETAEGNVLTGEEGTFDLNKQTGEVVHGRLFIRENHYYVYADRMEKLPEDTYLLEKAEVTTCDGVVPAWSITGSKVELTVEGYGTVKHATFRLRDFPLMYVPYVIFPGKNRRQTGLLIPRVGYSTLNGAEMEVPFFWAISDQMDATFYQNYMTERGYMQGLEYRYVAPEDSKGTFMYDILDDKRKKDLNKAEDVEVSPFPRTNNIRYWLRGMADQRLPQGLEARLDADYVSDQDYLREFQQGLFGLQARPDLPEEFHRPVEEKYSPLRRSALRLSRDRSEYSLQGLASYHENPIHPSDDQTPQPLGGLNYILLPERIGALPMFFGIGSEYDYIWRDVGVSGQRLDLSPTVRFPLLTGPYLELEPSFTYSLATQWFDDEMGNEKFQDKHAYEASVQMLSNIARVYDLEWRNAKRVMHRIWPKLTYTYRAPPEEEEEDPWFEPIDVPGRINQIAFSLENFLDARLENEQGKVSYRQWATLDITQAYNITRNELPNGQKREAFEPLTATMTVNPYPKLNFLGVARWDYSQSAVTYGDVSLDWRVARGGTKEDVYAVDYLFQKDNHESLSLRADVYVAYGFSVGTTYKKDFYLDQKISSTYWVEYQNQCWGVRVGVESEEDQTRGILLFKLLGLGELRAW